MESQEQAPNGPTQPTSNAQENTPLLASQSPDGGQQQYEATTTERQSSDAEVQRPSYPTRFRVSSILFSSLLLFGITTLALKVAESAVELYGSRNFGFYDYTMSDDSPLIVVGLIGVFFTLANLARLRHSGRPAAPLVNVVVYGISAVTFCTIAFGIIFRRIYEGVRDCNSNLDSPDNWYPGTLEECRKWRLNHVVVSWIYIVVAFIYGLIAVATTVTIFVSVYRGRSGPLDERGASWTLPAGQLSVEVSFRWGPPPSQRTERNADPSASADTP